MGINVYLKWDGQSEAERRAQYTGFSTVHGHVGYLREAYHGGPYATKVLIPEGWRPADLDEDGWASVPASTLRVRLPAVIAVAKERYAKIYDVALTDDAEQLKAYRDFVELYERLESEGKHPRIYVSA